MSQLLKVKFCNSKSEGRRALLLNIQVFWEVMPCRLVNGYRHF